MLYPEVLCKRSRDPFPKCCYREYCYLKKTVHFLQNYPISIYIIDYLHHRLYRVLYSDNVFQLARQKGKCCLQPGKICLGADRVQKDGYISSKQHVSYSLTEQLGRTFQSNSSSTNKEMVTYTARSCSSQKPLITGTDRSLSCYLHSNTMQNKGSFLPPRPGICLTYKLNTAAYGAVIKKQMRGPGAVNNLSIFHYSVHWKTPSFNTLQVY